MTQDTTQLKGKIVEFIRANGPSLPVQIAKHTGLSILFASAFLSELFGDKKIRMSSLRIGSSPLYFLNEQESQLENFSQYLKSKDKEAYNLLKEKKILRDSEQQPAIRVALREIKDYAFPFYKDEDLFWRYFLFSEEEVRKYFEETSKIHKEKIAVESKKEAGIVENIEEENKEESPLIRLEKEEGTTKKKITQVKSSKKKVSKKSNKKDENFFNKIKEFLSKKQIEIIDIISFKNDEAIMKVNKSGVQEIFFFYNKKKISEKEILSSFKKIGNNKLKHSIFFLGEPSKKIKELVESIKNLSDLSQIE